MLSVDQNTSIVRVDIFKPSGKWYETAYIDMKDFQDGSIHDCLLNACEKAFDDHNGRWPLVTSPKSLLSEGFMIVCIEPYHKKLASNLFKGKK